MMIRFLMCLLVPCPALALELDWSLSLPKRKPAWEHTPRMPLDREYRPVEFQNLILVGCEHNNALLALDKTNGRERWRFYTNGPIRFAPVVSDKLIFVGSDDGVLYCLDEKGNLKWSKRGGRSNRKIIGHERMMSVWPISTRPVIHSGVIYTVAGYWPVDGIFIHALDANSGKSLWINRFAEFRPFGDLRIHEEKLIVLGHPRGAMFDLKSGQQLTGKLPKRKPITRTALKTKPKEQKNERADTSRAEKLIKLAGAEGYCLIAGLKDGSLIEELLQKSSFHLVAIDKDRALVNEIRSRLDRRGAFDTHRLDLIVADPESSGLPPYFASLITTELTSSISDKLKECLRPYGGTLIEGDKVTRHEGALKGADDWRQEFHDEANTLSSSDARVQLPLGLLWYGGLAAHGRFYFDGFIDHQSGHGLNPQPVPAQILEGRMILQSPGLLSAFDIYTGRRLWESPLPKMYTFGGPKGGLGVHSKKHPKPWAYEPAHKFEVPPTHRCRPSGFNFVSTPEGIYLCAGRHLLCLDPKNGKQISKWKVPMDGDFCWGGIRFSGDTLVTTVFRPQDVIDCQAGHDGNGGDWAGDRLPMSHLLVLDRRTGKLLWSRQSNRGFLNRSGFAIGAGKLFCVDLHTSRVEKKLKEAGRKLSTTSPTLYALDLKSGKELWSYPLDVYAQNLVYSAKHDSLLLTCRNLMEWSKNKWVDRSIDIRKGKRNKSAPGKMRAMRGRDGKILWEVAEAAYHTPQVILDDLLIDRWGYSYSLLNGKRHRRTSPLTGELETWSFRKSGCNHLIACENLVTWRCACYDLKNQSGVLKLTGMDAGCAPTLLPAGGVVSVPNFGTHHKRNRMTALALVHRPENVVWTNYHTSREKMQSSTLFKRAGFNLGARGDHFDSAGTLWLQIGARHRSNAQFKPKNVRWVHTTSQDHQNAITGSALVGASEIILPLSRGGKSPSNQSSQWTIRLHFAELEAIKQGERVFSVALEGKKILSNLDILSRTKKRFSPWIHEIKNVKAQGKLDIKFIPVRGEPLLCGVEVIREK